MSAILVNVSLAVCWLILAAGIFVIEAQQGPLPWRPADVSAGWLALGLAGFNIVRVGTVLFFRRQQRRRTEQADEQQRQEFQRRQPPRVQQPPDPNFQFTDPPPAPDNPSS